jgi:hypothetical protein
MRTALAVDAALIAARSAVNGGGLELRRRQLVTLSLKACSVVIGSPGVGEGVRFREGTADVESRSVVTGSLIKGGRDGAAEFGEEREPGGDSEGRSDASLEFEATPDVEGPPSPGTPPVEGSLSALVPFFALASASFRCCSSCSSNESRIASIIINSSRSWPPRPIEPINWLSS